MREITLRFIRHSITPNNLEGRFGGRLDPPLAEEGKAMLTELVAKYPYPPVERLYSSPTQRCYQTAAIVYPGMEPVAVDGLRELDFGDIENKLSSEIGSIPGIDKFNRQELDFAFPNGETLGQCLERGIGALNQIIGEACVSGLSVVGVVTHSMMLSLIGRNCVDPVPTSEELFCPNGMGMEMLADPERWKKAKKLTLSRLLPVGAPRPKLTDSPYHNHKWQEGRNA